MTNNVVTINLGDEETYIETAIMIDRIYTAVDNLNASVATSSHEIKKTKNFDKLNECVQELYKVTKLVEDEVLLTLTNGGNISKELEYEYFIRFDPEHQYVNCAKAAFDTYFENIIPDKNGSYVDFEHGVFGYKKLIERKDDE